MNITKKLPTMPCTLIMVVIWVAVWLIIRFNDISPILCGKGISKIGNEYYRVFTAGLTHKHLVATDVTTIVIHAIALALGAVAGVVYWLFNK